MGVDRFTHKRFDPSIKKALSLKPQHRILGAPRHVDSKRQGASGKDHPEVPMIRVFGMRAP